MFQSAVKPAAAVFLLVSQLLDASPSKQDGVIRPTPFGLLRHD